MIRLLVTTDLWLRKLLTGFCMLMLLLMVMFTVYTVIMRYVFENPPVWGDLLTVLSNIWLVFFALVITVREKEHIALNLVYSRLPAKAAFLVQQFWTAVIFLLGIVICVYGWEVVNKMGGKYWEMWHFGWEQGTFVFYPNYMPKKYAVMILPITGAMVSLAALVAILEDTVRFKHGTFTPAGETDQVGDLESK